MGVILIHNAGNQKITGLAMNFLSFHRPRFPSSSFPAVFCYGDFRFCHGFPVTLSAIVTVLVQSRVVKHCILNVFRLFSRYLAEISASREDRLALAKVEEGSTTATASSCSFPSSWAGSWFLRKEISPSSEQIQ
jgi:hypothetical protein